MVCFKETRNWNYREIQNSIGLGKTIGAVTVNDKMSLFGMEFSEDGNRYPRLFENKGYRKLQACLRRTVKLNH